MSLSLRSNRTVPHPTHKRRHLEGAANFEYVLLGSLVALTLVIGLSLFAKEHIATSLTVTGERLLCAAAGLQCSADTASTAGHQELGRERLSPTADHLSLVGEDGSDHLPGGAGGTDLLFGSAESGDATEAKTGAQLKLSQRGKPTPRTDPSFDPGQPVEGPVTPELWLAITRDVVGADATVGLLPAVDAALRDGWTPNEVRRQLMTSMLAYVDPGFVTSASLIKCGDTLCARFPQGAGADLDTNDVFLLSPSFGEPVAIDRKRGEFGRVESATATATRLIGDVFRMDNGFAAIRFDSGFGVQPALADLARSVAYGFFQEDPGFLQLGLNNTNQITVDYVPFANMPIVGTDAGGLFFDKAVKGTPDRAVIRQIAAGLRHKTPATHVVPAIEAALAAGWSPAAIQKQLRTRILLENESGDYAIQAALVKCGDSVCARTGRPLDDPIEPYFGVNGFFGQPVIWNGERGGFDSAALAGTTELIGNVFRNAEGYAFLNFPGAGGVAPHLVKVAYETALNFFEPDPEFLRLTMTDGVVHVRFTGTTPDDPIVGPTVAGMRMNPALYEDAARTLMRSGVSPEETQRALRNLVLMRDKRHGFIREGTLVQCGERVCARVRVADDDSLGGDAFGMTGYFGAPAGYDTKTGHLFQWREPRVNTDIAGVPVSTKGDHLLIELEWDNPEKEQAARASAYPEQYGEGPDGKPDRALPDVHLRRVEEAGEEDGGLLDGTFEVRADMNEGNRRSTLVRDGARLRPRDF